MKNPPVLIRVCAGLLLALGAPGCATLALFKTADKYDTADVHNPAAEILAIWQPAEGPGKLGVPTRGFSGQVYFFTRGEIPPVAVSGRVRIYLFDDKGSVEQQGKPIHVFEFDPGAWNAHLQVGKLGPSYGVFIPYPRDDFHQVNCSLRMKLVPTSGPTIYSPESTIVLPGPPIKQADDDTSITARLGEAIRNAQTGTPNRSQTNVPAKPSGAADSPVNQADLRRMLASMNLQSAHAVSPSTTASTTPSPSQSMTASATQSTASQTQRMRDAGLSCDDDSGPATTSSLPSRSSLPSHRAALPVEAE